MPWYIQQHRQWHGRRGRSGDPRANLLREMRKQAREDPSVDIQGYPNLRNRTPRRERWAGEKPSERPYDIF